MTIDEYFGDWYKIIPIKELKEALSKINTEICPERNKVFRASSKGYCKWLSIW